MAMEMEKWVNGYFGVNGEVLQDISISGKFGDVWVGIAKEKDIFCVFCIYPEVYQPPFGDEFYFTREPKKARKVFREAIDNVQDWVAEKDEYEEWLMKRAEE